MVKIEVVDISKPEEVNMVIGMTHFIKSIEDIYEAVADSAPGAKFGVAFCEASGPKLIRKAGNNEEMVELAVKNAERIGAGHSFLIMLKGIYPINILPRLRQVPEIVSIIAATANPLQVAVAETGQGRGIMGVIDGGSPAGVENQKEEAERKEFLRKIGYKL